MTTVCADGLVGGTVTDAQLAAVLQEAHLPSLLPALALLAGDADSVTSFYPAKFHVTDPQGGMSAEQQSRAREFAVDVLRRTRDGGHRVGEVDTETLRVLLTPYFGAGAVDDYLPIAVEELALDDVDRRAPDWVLDEVAAPPRFPVVVIGAGLSGLLAAYRLSQAQLPYLVLEKNADIGGTWLANTYPGCRVDVPTHLYTYSFTPTDDWHEVYASQQTIKARMMRFVAESGIRQRIRLGTAVTDCTFDEADGTWLVHTRRTDGTVEQIRAFAVISAVGQLFRPLIPDIPGRDVFGGPAFHTAEWRHDIPLTGRRVALVGTGSSAMQLAPHIVDDSSLVVFQRSPAWMMPTPDWQAPVPTGLAWLLRNVPHYERFYRLYTFASLSDDLQHFSRIDASWDDGGRSVSKLNARFRAVLQDYLDDQFSDRPDLLPRVSPDYPPFGKRIVRDDGGWAMALKHPNTTLVTTPIERFTETGIVTADGAHHDVDVVVYGTGFEASKFLVPMRITGRGGIDLHRRWGADTSAYLGMTVPGFPNFFMLYGPNTNIVLNGSVVWLSECEVRYVLGCLRLALEQGGPLSCRQEVYDAFAEEIDTANREMAWGSDAVNSWYKNASGRVTQNWPLTLLEFWRRTRTPNLTDFEVAASTTVENTVRSNRCVRS